MATGVSDWMLHSQSPCVQGPRSAWAPISEAKPPPAPPDLHPHWYPPLPSVCPLPTATDCGDDAPTVASGGLLPPAPRPRSHVPPARGHRDSPDGLAPVAPQRLPNGLHVRLELGEAELPQEGAVVCVLAGGGHEEVMHCNDSAQGPSPPASPGPTPPGIWSACEPVEGAGRCPRSGPARAEGGLGVTLPLPLPEGGGRPLPPAAPRGSAPRHLRGCCAPRGPGLTTSGYLAVRKPS